MRSDAAKAATGKGTAARAHTPVPRNSKGPDILLVADDFAISAGVSEAIEQLARAQRISATSALVTLPRWQSDGVRLAALRPHIAVGLHVNLTLGRPIGAMTSLAPAGDLPPLGTLVRRALLRRIDPDEVRNEIARQLRHFEQVVGHAPDFIDGHQHIHALPVIRGALLAAIADQFSGRDRKPLVRVPSNPVRPELAGLRGGKAALLSALTRVFRSAVKKAGLPANDSFAGVSRFAPSEDDVRRDLDAAALGSRGLHLVMCHPGIPSPELARLDPLTTRRASELAVLSDDNVLTPRIIRLKRTDADETAPIDWRAWTT